MTKTEAFKDIVQWIDELIPIWAECGVGQRKVKSLTRNLEVRPWADTLRLHKMLKVCFDDIENINNVKIQLPPASWTFYLQMGITDQPEQIELARLQNVLRDRVRSFRNEE